MNQTPEEVEDILKRARQHLNGEANVLFWAPCDGFTYYWIEDDMEVLTENNGWAIVWMHGKYFVRHLPPCGTFLRGNATMGCTCRGKFKNDPKKVDGTILAKFRILTLRENLK